MGVGMPANILLHQFGQMIYEVFGEWPYHVGSSLTEKVGWRDVDVRLILPDEQFAGLFGKVEDLNVDHKGWAITCLAYSLLGKQVTGLPIDFQIQAQSIANARYKGRRSCLILWAIIEDSIEEHEEL